MPSFERIRVRGAERSQLFERRLAVADGEVKGSVIDLVLEGSMVCHVFKVALC